MMDFKSSKVPNMSKGDDGKMNEKFKVTYTFFTDRSDPTYMDQPSIALRVRMVALAADEKMAAWARELGVSRQFISQVVNGARKTQRVRDFIEGRLGETFWPKEEAKQ